MTSGKLPERRHLLDAMLAAGFRDAGETVGGGQLLAWPGSGTRDALCLLTDQASPYYEQVLVGALDELRLAARRGAMAAVVLDQIDGGHAADGLLPLGCGRFVKLIDTHRETVAVRDEYGEPTGEMTRWADR